jgi:predicted RNA binding protein YcfA (HicA-like mRNA interferase family)
MTDDLGQLAHLLRNTPVREFIAALRRDGFSVERQTRTGGRIYGHPDGRLTSIHYHTGSDTLTRKTLRSVLQVTRWTEDDLRRLGLLPCPIHSSLTQQSPTFRRRYFFL